MANIRIKIRKGDKEIEIEGSAEAVEAWYKKLSDQLNADPNNIISPPQRSSDKKEQVKEQLNESLIANNIQANEKWDIIYDRIVRKKDRLAKILLVLKFSPNNALTSGQIENVLSILKCPIGQANVSIILNKSGKYVMAKRVDKKTSEYKINVNGEDYVNQLLT